MTAWEQPESNQPIEHASYPNKAVFVASRNNDNGSIHNEAFDIPIAVNLTIACLVGLLAAYGVNVIGLTDIAGVEPLFVFVIVAFFSSIGLTLLKPILGSSTRALALRAFLPYVAMQCMFVWGGLNDVLVDIKLDKIAMLIGFSGLGVIILQHLWALLKQPILRLMLSFLILNGIYLFIHGSDFSLGGASAGYLVNANMSGAADTPSKTIIFVLCLGIVSALICGYGVFQNLKPKSIAQFNAIVQWVAVTLFGSVLVYAGLSALGGFGKISPGHSTLVVLLFIWVLGIASSWPLLVTHEEVRPDGKPSFIVGLIKTWFPRLALIAMGGITITLFLGMNKTSLAGLGFALVIFEGLNQLYSKGQISVFGVIPQPIRTNPIWWVVIAAIFAGGLMASGMMDVISEKMSYFVEGFQSMSTLRVRTSNWHYFMLDWEDTITPFKLLFGYGLGASRDTIFHISAMREGGYTNLVQTLHNHYLATFYDYGLMSIMYWLGWMGLLFSFFRAAANSQMLPSLRLLVHMAIATQIFMFGYLLMDGLRVHVAIICFAYWGLVYGAIHAQNYAIYGGDTD